MIWWLLIALTIGITAYNLRGEWLDDKFFYFFGIFIAALFATVVFVPLGFLVSAYGPLHYEDGGTYELVAVNDGTKISGGAFLFSGYIDQSQVYNFYEKTGPNTYQRGWQYAAHSTIVEDQPKGKANLHQYFLVPNKWIAFEWATHLRNEFHVPPGSVVQEVTFDNQ